MVEGLCAGYGAQTVLDRLSFRLPERRISVVLGPGGSGKTTLLKVLAAEPCAGLWWHGRVELRPGVPGVLHQKPEPQPTRLADLLSEPATERAALERWLHTFWGCAPAVAEVLGAMLDAPFSTLPSHLRRLATFTSACSRPAPFYLFDEPEVALEGELQDGLVAKLAELHGRETLVVVTHNLRFARQIADYALMLLDGQLLEAGEAPVFFETPRHPRTEHYIRLGG